MSRNTILSALLLVPALAIGAEPIVWNHIPNFEVADTSGTRLDAVNHKVTTAQTKLEATRDKRIEHKVDLRDARHELTGRKADVFAARVELWAARRNHDAPRIAAARHSVGEAVQLRELGRDHIAWHHDVLTADRRRIAVAEADVSVATARREREEARIVLADQPQRYMKPFVHQVDQLERVRDHRVSLVHEADAQVVAARAAYLAAL